MYFLEISMKIFVDERQDIWDLLQNLGEWMEGKLMPD